ncbi:MAG TPA: hypothetical protein VFE42_08835 [Chloroflexota bacterium]|nr:hypothetical protein [Chloroflexota bacterium]
MGGRYLWRCLPGVAVDGGVIATVALGLDVPTLRAVADDVSVGVGVNGTPVDVGGSDIGDVLAAVGVAFAGAGRVGVGTPGVRVGGAVAVAAGVLVDVAAGVLGVGVAVPTLPCS